MNFWFLTTLVSGLIFVIIELLQAELDYQQNIEMEKLKNKDILA